MQETSSAAKSFFGAALQWLAPLALSAVIGYGGAQYAQGRNETRLSHVETLTEKAKTEHANFVTRDEFRLAVEATRDDLREIKADVRAMRQELSRR